MGELFQEPSEVVAVQRRGVSLPPGEARLRRRMVLVSESALSLRSASPRHDRQTDPKDADG